MEENEVSVSAKPIGGWLSFLAIGIASSYIILITTFILTHLRNLLNGSWTPLISKTSAIYHPMYLPTLLLQFTGAVISLLFLFSSTFFFLKKDHRFPKFYSIFFAFQILVNIYVCSAFLAYPQPVKEVIDQQIISTIASTIIASVWIAYLFISQRSRETFVLTSTMNSKTIKVFNISAFAIITILFATIMLNRNYAEPAKVLGEFDSTVYPAYYEKNFISACEGNGTPKVQCECVLGKMKSSFTYNEMLKIEASLARKEDPGTFANLLSEANDQCLNGK